MVTPIEELSHDHRELGELLVAVHEALVRVDRGESKLEDELHEISDGIEAFREHLLEHFAREQEGLFPFVVARLPSAKDKADQALVEHDDIAAALSLLVNETRNLEAHPDTALMMWRASLDRFEELYADHSRFEIAFLREVAGALAANPGAAEELRRLLDEV